MRCLVERRAGVQEWMAEPAHLAAAVQEQLIRDALAGDDVVFVVVDVDAMQVGMRVGVIAELEAGVEPLLEQSDLRRITFAVRLELVLVHEADRRNARGFDRREQVAGEGLLPRDRHRSRNGGKVVEGDGDLAGHEGSREKRGRPQSTDYHPGMMLKP